MKPKPFARDSISLDKSRRSWRHVEAREVQIDDIVAGIGLVTGVGQYQDIIEFLNAANELHTRNRSDVVLGFVPDAS